MRKSLRETGLRVREFKGSGDGTYDFVFIMIIINNKSDFH